jgi:hypothetical protein
MKRRLLLPVAVPACAVVLFTGGSAAAVVHFDPESGKGFAGRADVRAAFGWTYKQVRDRAEELTFAYVDAKTYEVACRSGQRVESFTAHTSDEKIVRSKVRWRAAALRGFGFSGYGGRTSSTDLYQEEGRPCEGTDGGGTFSGTWGPVEQTDTTLGLVVRYRDQQRLLT